MAQRSRTEDAVAKNLCKIASGETAGDVHLPKPVLRGDVALSSKQVIEICSVDMRDIVFVAPDRDCGLQACELDLPIHLRQLLTHGMTQPEHAAGSAKAR